MSRTSRGNPRMPSARGRMRLTITSWCRRPERSSLRRAKLSKSSACFITLSRHWSARSRTRASIPKSGDGMDTSSPLSFSSTTAKVSQSSTCAARRWSRESTNGRSWRVSTSDSPASPTKRVRLSADTRTTRSACSILLAADTGWTVADGSASWDGGTCVSAVVGIRATWAGSTGAGSTGAACIRSAKASTSFSALTAHRLSGERASWARAIVERKSMPARSTSACSGRT